MVTFKSQALRALRKARFGGRPPPRLTGRRYDSVEELLIGEGVSLAVLRAFNRLKEEGFLTTD